MADDELRKSFLMEDEDEADDSDEDDTFFSAEDAEEQIYGEEFLSDSDEE